MRRYFGLLFEHQAMSATNTRATANPAARPTAEEMRCRTSDGTGPNVRAAQARRNHGRPRGALEPPLQARSRADAEPRVHSRTSRATFPFSLHTLSACHKCRCWCRGKIVKHEYRLYRTRALNGDVTRT